ncbi:hypothetical protein RSOLAG1IB_06460 [Rhizoctonia solani AG-1 IB]|uniref:C2H2-type domain-containing protein n=1 Tax=Thanatephorus cucumeris (strain AG1-IB / isolate 7/3/14) TaxID=1108050 RepID=A0A0B7F7V0_THACB|nr:hypothetical protein RSOLAG1IB_06460 [Rhizoctonia solani AG-1 IB]
MAPPGSLVHSAEGIAISMPQAGTSLFTFPFNFPLIHLVHKGEHISPRDNLHTEVGGPIQRSSLRAAKQQQEIQIHLDMLSNILWDNFNVPNNKISKRVNVRDLGHPKLMVKLEPDADGASCSLFKSLSDSCSSSSKVSKHDFSVKSELKPEPVPASPHNKDIRADFGYSSLCSAGKPQDIPIISNIQTNKSQSCRDGSHSNFSEEGQTTTKLLRTSGQSSYSSEQLIATHTNTLKALRQCLVNKQDMPPSSKFALYSQLSHLCYSRPVINQQQARTAQHPPSGSWQCEDSNYEHLNHQDIDAPKLSRLNDSLFGLVSSCRVKPPARYSTSSLGPSDTIDSPTHNQAQYNSNSAPGPSAAGGTNNFLANAGQKSKSGTDETTNGAEIDGLDAQSLYELGFYCYTLALQRDPSITNQGASQDHVPDLVPLPPSAPVPLPLQLNLEESGARGIFPGSNYPSVPGADAQYRLEDAASTNWGPVRVDANGLQTGHIQNPFNGGLPVIDSGVDAQLLPHHTISGRPATGLPNYSGVFQGAPPYTDFNYSTNHIYTFRTNSSSAGPSTLEDNHQALIKASKTCYVCGRHFHRPNSLKDHMHTHTGLKRHKCRICGQCISWTSGLSRHMKKVHGSDTRSRNR